MDTTFASPRGVPARSKTKAGILWNELCPSVSSTVLSYSPQKRAPCFPIPGAGTICTQILLGPGLRNPQNYSFEISSNGPLLAQICHLYPVWCLPQGYILPDLPISNITTAQQYSLTSCPGLRSASEWTWFLSPAACYTPACNITAPLRMLLAGDRRAWKSPVQLARPTLRGASEQHQDSSLRENLQLQMS
jgi:hypothetical protein